MQKLIGVGAVTSKAVATFRLTTAELQRACTGLLRFTLSNSAGLFKMQKLIGVAAVTSKAVATFPLTTAELQRACTGS